MKKNDTKTYQERMKELDAKAERIIRDFEETNERIQRRRMIFGRRIKT